MCTVSCLEKWDWWSLVRKSKLQIHNKNPKCTSTKY